MKYKKKIFYILLFTIILTQNIVVLAQMVNEWEMQDDLIKDFTELDKEKDQKATFDNSQFEDKKQQKGKKTAPKEKQEKFVTDEDFIDLDDDSGPVKDEKQQKDKKTAPKEKQEKFVTDEDFINLDDDDSGTKKFVSDEDFVEVGDKAESKDWLQGENLVEDEEYLNDEELVKDDFINEDVDIADKEYHKGKKNIEEILKQQEEGKIVFKVSDPVKYFRKKYLSSEMDEILRSTLYYRFQSFFHNIPTNKREFQHELTLKFEINKKIGLFEINLVPELNIDDFNANHEFYTFIHLDDNGAKRSSINFAEAYISMQLGDFDIAFGKKIYAWGKAYGPNPTDNINPYDLIDPVEGFNIDNDRKIGVWSLFIKYYFPSIAFFEFPSLEAIFVPRFTKNRGSFPYSRWYVDYYSDFEEEETLPDHTFGNSQWALRLSSTVKGWDFSFSYYNGFLHSSNQRIHYKEVTIPFPPYNYYEPYKIENFYDEVHIVGFDIITTYKAFRFFFEGIHCWSKENNQDDYFNIIFGTDWRCNNLFVKDDKLTIVFECFFNRIVTREGNDPDVIGFNDYGDRGSILIFQYELNQSWTFHLSTVTNFNENYDWTGDFQEIGVRYKVNLNLILGLKAQFFNGKSELDTYGAYSDNDSVFFTCDYAF